MRKVVVNTTLLIALSHMQMNNMFGEGQSQAVTGDGTEGPA